jgi:hypothetical protein
MRETLGRCLNQFLNLEVITATNESSDDSYSEDPLGLPKSIISTRLGPIEGSTGAPGNLELSMKRPDSPTGTRSF